MDIKYGHGLEFATTDESQEEKPPAITPEREAELEQIMRDGFRAPVGLSELVSLAIGGKHYVVYNLSSAGVGIYLNQPGEIKNFVQLQGVVLTIMGQSFSVNGEVRHLSNDGIHDLCGIELTSISPECQEAIISCIQKSRNTLFVP